MTTSTINKSELAGFFRQLDANPKLFERFSKLKTPEDAKKLIADTGTKISYEELDGVLQQMWSKISIKKGLLGGAMGKGIGAIVGGIAGGIAGASGGAIAGGIGAVPGGTGGAIAGGAGGSVIGDSLEDMFHKLF